MTAGCLPADRAKARAAGWRSAVDPLREDNLVRVNFIENKLARKKVSTKLNDKHMFYHPDYPKSTLSSTKTAGKCHQAVCHHHHHHHHHF